MERNGWQEDLEENKTYLCINCFNCKTKNNKIYCKYNNFKDLQYKDVCLLSPLDYDCWQFEE